MSKLKSPLLSLGAQGTIGNSLTFQKRGQETIAREKPIPKDPYSLAQAYHRWLYQDYAHLWTLQSEAIKQSYRTRGSRYHITGFNLWMREHLRDLPDIAALWHLDYISGGVTLDSSRNANTGTVIGASSTIALIDHGLYFDGLNDYIHVPVSPSLKFTGDFSVEFFCHPIDPGANARVIVGRNFTVWEVGLAGTAWANCIDPRIGGVALWTGGDMAGHWDKDLHIAVTWQDDINTAIKYINGQQVSLRVQATSIPISTNDLSIGRRLPPGAYWNKDWLDHIQITTRVLSPYEILTHSERRYPVQ